MQDDSVSEEISPDNPGSIIIPDETNIMSSGINSFGMTTFSAEEEIALPTEEEEVYYPYASAKPKKVAILRIFSTNDGSSSSLNFSGHSWITITNVSGKYLTIGKLGSIKSGNTVSVGTWGKLKDKGTDADRVNFKAFRWACEHTYGIKE